MVIGIFKSFNIIRTSIYSDCFSHSLNYTSCEDFIMFLVKGPITYHIGDLVQDSSNSSALALTLLQSCAKQSKSHLFTLPQFPTDLLLCYFISFLDFGCLIDIDIHCRYIIPEKEYQFDYICICWRPFNRLAFVLTIMVRIFDDTFSHTASSPRGAIIQGMVYINLILLLLN